METLDLVRRPSIPDGTFGRMLRDGQEICLTCEPEIPFLAGTYLCIPHTGSEFQNVWEISGIVGHTAVLIHNGNTKKDTKLCVLVGNIYGQVDGLKAVLNSKSTLDRLRATLPSTFYLRVYAV